MHTHKDEIDQISYLRKRSGAEFESRQKLKQKRLRTTMVVSS